MSENCLPHMKKGTGDVLTVDRAMQESLKYDRAYARLQVLISDLLSNQRISDKEELAEGNQPDASYDLLITDLKKLQMDYRAESGRLWKMAETNKDIYAKAYEDLANAIVQAAAEDYTMALCGGMNESEKMLIELFADACDSGELAFTKIKVHVILDRIKRAHEDFVKFVKAHGKEIVAETKERKAKHKPMSENSFRCPMCGGALYEQSQYGVHRIVCTSCYMSAVIKTEKKKKL